MRTLMMCSVSASDVHRFALVRQLSPNARLLPFRFSQPPLLTAQCGEWLIAPAHRRFRRLHQFRCSRNK